MAELTPLPDFDLAALERVAPEKLVAEGKASELEMFMLALALFYNDWKDLAWMSRFLRPHQRDDAEMSPVAGQLAGMNNHLVRLMVAMLHELMRLIQEHSEVANGRELVNLAASIPKESRDAWKAILEAASGGDGRGGKFGRALQRVRDSVAFHYYNPKSLAQGYRAHFFGPGPRSPKQEAALFSLGPNMEGTRFYFADAAADAAMKAQAAGAGADDFFQQYDAVGEQLNFALYSLVKRFIRERRVSNA